MERGVRSRCQGNIVIPSFDAAVTGSIVQRPASQAPRRGQETTPQRSVQQLDVAEGVALNSGMLDGTEMPTRAGLPTLIGPSILATMIVVCLALGAWTILDRRSMLDGDEHWGEVHDAGRLLAEVQPVIEHTFHVVNSTPKTIKLVSKSCTCTCTTSGLSQEVLRPNEAATFTMSIRMPGGYSRESSVSCDLLFDDNRVRTYRIAYESFPRIMVEDSYLDLGTIDPDASRSQGQGDAQGALGTWVDLFAPAGQRLPSLESI